MWAWSWVPSCCSTAVEPPPSQSEWQGLGGRERRVQSHLWDDGATPRRQGIVASFATDLLGALERHWTLLGLHSPPPDEIQKEPAI